MNEEKIKLWIVLAAVCCVTAMIVLFLDFGIKREILRATNQAHDDLDKMLALEPTFQGRRHAKANEGRASRPAHSDGDKSGGDGTGVLANPNATVETSASDAPGNEGNGKWSGQSKGADRLGGIARAGLRAEGKRMGSRPAGTRPPKEEK